MREIIYLLLAIKSVYYLLLFVLLASGCITGQVAFDMVNISVNATSSTVDLNTSLNDSGTGENITLPSNTLPNLTASKKTDDINVTISGINSTAEWAEIKNNGSDVNLTKWSVSDTANHRYIFNIVLPANASVKLHTKQGADNLTDLYWGYKISVWNDEGDTATLADNKGRIVHTYAYNKSASKSSTTSTTVTTSLTSTSTSTSITTTPTSSTVTTTTEETTSTVTSTTATTTTTVPFLSADMSVLPQTLVRGNYVNITVLVSSGGIGISGADVFTKITYASGSNQTNSSATNQTGHYVWRKLIGPSSKNGTFYVESSAGKNGYGNATVNTSFEVISA